MNRRTFRQIADSHLLPFFSGASLLDGFRASRRADPLVEQLNDSEIAFKPSSEADFRLVLTRRQPFSQADEKVVPESAVVESFVNALALVSPLLDSPLKADLLNLLPRRVVANAVCAKASDLPTIVAGVDQMEAWSNKLYEGVPISAALGFRNTPQAEETIRLKDIGSKDFGAVLSNGHDTLLEFDYSGRFIDHAVLDAGETRPSNCPIGFAAIAQWTSVRDRRVAFALNRLGEILIFRDRELLFARRSNRWSFLTHKPIVTQMGKNINSRVRQAIYSSCLDASFARTGACIGVLNRGVSDTEISKLVRTEDVLSNKNGVKASTLSKIIDDQDFRFLPRDLRRELLAIDGATILANDGSFIAVGAILRISGGSPDGGGRLAAAKALSSLGLGIKISQDGGITGYANGQDEPVFKVM